MTPAKILAEASRVDVAFSGNAVLSNVDLVVREREIVTLSGPNGSGKSTLVRLVLGLLEADRGRVFLRPGLRIGYMPQRLVIDDALPLTVERFLALGGAACVIRHHCGAALAFSTSGPSASKLPRWRRFGPRAATRR